MKNLLKIFALILMASLVFSCQQSASENNSSDTAEVNNADLKGQSAVKDDLSSKNILQVAMGSKDHTTLVAGVQAAELENVLVNAGPLTVFAPTNAAFDLLPEGTLEELLKPENKKTLGKIIKYHAAPGNYTADLLKDGQKLFQASGHYVTIAKDGENISVEGANVIGTVQTSNGIIHVVDKVLLPPQ